MQQQFLMNTILTMAGLFYYLPLIPFGIYFTWLCCLALRFVSEKQFMPALQDARVRISVIVAARNEQENIPLLAECLFSQSYPNELFEVIAVNDHSDDRTLDMLRELALSFPNLKVLDLPGGRQGKKAALAHGIAHASGELVVTTDADCAMGEKWLSTLAAFYVQHAPDMIIAPVRVSYRSVFEALQSLELSALVTLAAASAFGRNPVLCNGANLAFRKKAFDEVKGYAGHEDSPSGDDVFLMQEMKSAGKKIFFIKSKSSIVTTRPQEELKDLLDQRSRWASKWGIYKDQTLFWMVLLSGSINFLLVLFVVLSIFSNTFATQLLLMFALRSGADLILIGSGIEYSGKKQLLLFYLPAAVIYPAYFLLAGLGALKGSYSWKGRDY